MKNIELSNKTLKQFIQFHTSSSVTLPQIIHLSFWSFKPASSFNEPLGRSSEMNMAYTSSTWTPLLRGQVNPCPWQASELGTGRATGTSPKNAHAKILEAVTASCGVKLIVTVVFPPRLRTRVFVARTHIDGAYFSIFRCGVRCRALSIADWPGGNCCYCKQEFNEEDSGFHFACGS